MTTMWTDEHFYITTNHVLETLVLLVVFFVEKPTISFVNQAEVTHNLFLAGSDMELDLLAAAETESDSESNHSNQDNASGRRSVVTAATAGSEAGASI